MTTPVIRKQFSQYSPDVVLNLAQHLVADSSRIRQELGFTEATSPDIVFERLIEWERTGGPSMDPAELDDDREDELIRK